MKVTLNNVRLSFPCLFVAKKMKDDPNSKASFSASFLLDKKENASQIDVLRGAVDAVVKEHFKGVYKGIKLCVHDGSEKEETPGYGEGVIFISSRSERRPSVVDCDLAPITEDDQRIYAGCYVNAVVRLWAQNNSFGKRVNAQLQGVQFVRQGEAFGEKPFNPNEEFAPIASEEGDAGSAEPDAPESTGETSKPGKIPF